MMVILTVVGRKLAGEGTQFIFMGPLSDCKDCKVRNICFHLERGTKYRVVSTRDKTHKCPVHEDGVQVVQVEPVPGRAAIPKKAALEGSGIKMSLPNCRAGWCQHRRLCFPPGMENGQKRKVVKVLERVECAIGQNRIEVMLE